MISLQSAALRRGSKQLFENATLTLHAGEKIGIIGHNGCGKSSLFKVFVNELEVDVGDVIVPKGLQVAITKQEIDKPSSTILDYVLDGDQTIRHWQHKYSQAVETNDDDAIAKASEMLDTLQAWRAEPLAKQLLTGLGFDPEDFQRTVSNFSGGWQMRLNLARALIKPSDLLLLDEPTNHLDLDAILWLENWLVSYPGTLLLISHDRTFLDAVVNRIIHFQGLELKSYAGNYSAFEHQLAEQMALEASMQKKIEKQRKHLTSFVDRFRYKASKAKQAQSRVKQLEKLEDVAITQLKSAYRFEFHTKDKPPNPLSRLEDLQVGYDQTVIVDNIQWIIQARDRVGIIGSNGCGKSTLLKTLVGDLKPVSGECWLSDKTRIGYFDQHQLKQLDPDSTVIEVAQRAFPEEREQALMDYLGGFAFGGDRVYQPCHSLSGGEKSRLILSILMRQELNLLILDEPTNHLDLDARNALTLALQNFEGALILVSHDRHLLETSCEAYMHISRGKMQPFNGTMEDYTQLILAENKTVSPSEKKSEGRKEARQAAALKRQQVAPLKKKLNAVEKKMQQLQVKSEDIEQQLASPEMYEDGAKEKLKTLLQEQGETDKQLQVIEEEYLQALEALEVATDA